MQIFSRDDKSQRVQVFALHDTAANSHAMPLFFASEGLAVRAFQDAANGGDPNISKHPQAFTLHKIGTYDPVSGILYPEGPTLVVSAASLVNTK